MTRKPRIGLTARSPSALIPYQRCIELGGGLPIVLDPRTTRAELRRVYDSVDGLLLPGGAGLAWVWRRHRARSEAGPHRSPEHPEIECTDCQLARWALADDRPVLGICRGIQMIALAADGHLDRGVVGHRLCGIYPAHQAVIAPGSRLHDVLRSERTPVNSRHRRAVRDLPDASGLVVTARSAEDGVVEGIESRHHAFVVGVQFHPENLIDFHEPSRRLFRDFVAACRRHDGG